MSWLIAHWVNKGAAFLDNVLTLNNFRASNYSAAAKPTKPPSFGENVGCSVTQTMLAVQKFLST